VASASDTTDLHLELIDLLGNRVEMDAGIAFLVAMVSALRKTPATAALVVLGDLSIQGHIKAVHTLAEPLQIAMENGARRALVPVENERNFLEVSADIVERVDPAFYSDPQAACAKALG
jgi:ATP-dependent Lon protease